eukprot:scaffold56397_cov38-Phaeocystis_antarctica.AAC.1
METSANSPSSTPRQRQVKLRAISSLDQPRPHRGRGVPAAARTAHAGHVACGAGQVPPGRRVLQPGAHRVQHNLRQGPRAVLPGAPALSKCSQQPIAWSKCSQKPTRLLGAALWARHESPRRMAAVERQ